ncbi:hypothetical protein [Algoriphagus boritolerans]|nr:hypothetical protein [Algoriphagus boritolerans]
MKKKILLLSLLAIAFFSCDKENDTPALFFEGTYQLSRSDEAERPYFFKVMTFSMAGEVLIENFVLGVDSDEPCLQSYDEGTYRLVGEAFKLTLSSSFGPDPAAFEITQGCVPKESLVNTLNTGNMERNGRLIFGDSKESFSLAYECKDMLNTNSICLGPQTYEKIN